MNKTELKDEELDAIAAAGSAVSQEELDAIAAAGSEASQEEFRPITPADMPSEQSEGVKKALEAIKKATPTFKW